MDRGIRLRVNSQSYPQRASWAEFDRNVIDASLRINVGKKSWKPVGNCWPCNPDQLPEGKRVDHRI
jgi:hypothetical protein